MNLPKFDLQLFSDEGGNQPGGVSYDIDGEKISFNDLTPEHFGKVYDAYQNSQNFTAANTQRSQELAAKQKEMDDYKASVERQLQEHDAMVQYLNTHQDLASYVQNYVQKQQGGYGMNNPQAGQAQYGQPPQPFMDPMVQQLTSTIQELQKQIQEIKGVTDDGERMRARETAFNTLKGEYDDFDSNAIAKLMDELLPEEPSEKDLYNLIYLANHGRNVLAEKAKTGAALSQGTGASGNVTPHTVVESVTDENLDEVLDDLTEGFKEEQGLINE